MDSLAWEINWDLPRREFLKHVQELINLVVEEHLVIALPIPMVPGDVSTGLLGLVLSQVDCSGCNAVCCKENVKDRMMFVPPSEYEVLSRKYGDRYFKIIDELAYIQMPCPFLEHGKCSIYEDRPLVCVFYPFQPGATDPDDKPVLALDSRCPEARRISMRVYIRLWEISQKAKLLPADRKSIKTAASALREKGG